MVEHNTRIKNYIENKLKKKRTMARRSTNVRLLAAVGLYTRLNLISLVIMNHAKHS